MRASYDRHRVKDTTGNPAERGSCRRRPSLESETDALGRGQRALRQSRTRVAGVVVARRHVVRAGGIEQRREHLDVPAPDAELELAAAVYLDPGCGAVLDALEQPLGRPEARRL